MNIDLTSEELEFQAQVRDFFDNRMPAEVKRKQANFEHLTKEDYVNWQQALYAEGWSAINWPVEYGGTGWTITQKFLFSNEMSRANAPRIIPFGLNMVGPIIYTFGNEDQKARFLPDIRASRVWWCQGYSEPGSGSDLASLKTKAERQGDHYVVNGTKTWTTMAQHADWIFCLVRTSTHDKRQLGISFLLIDMATPGVSVRPIITLDGEHEVNEVHFENVKVPVENLVGEEGAGWGYGKVLLQHERMGIAGVGNSKYRLNRLRRMAAESPAGEPPLAEDQRFADKLARLEIELDALEYTELRVLASIKTGGSPGPESSILKIRGTEIQQRIDELLLELTGYYALPFIPDQWDAGFAGDRIGPENFADLAPRYFNNRKASIYGGSNEIQKNIIVKHVLGL